MLPCSSRAVGGCVALIVWGWPVVPLLAQTPVDLNTWSQQGNPSSSTWNVSPDGSSVLQTVNGGVGLFVSPNTFFNTTIEGSFGVEGTSDDDFIGFVFGYKAPLDETTTTGQNTVDFLLFDWKQANQAGASAGFRLSHVKGTHRGTSSDTSHELWTHTSSSTLTVTPLGTNYGIGWQDPSSGIPVIYDFTLLYTASQIRIDIAGGQFGWLGRPFLMSPSMILLRMCRRSLRRARSRRGASASTIILRRMCAISRLRSPSRF